MKHLPRLTILLGAVLLGSACGVPDHGPWMLPGDDCLSCHSANSDQAHHVWTVGGTVFDSTGSPVAGAQVIIRDASGRAVTLESNGGGNFYTGETLAEPYQSVSLIFAGKQIDMPTSSATPATGACNSCHRAGGQAGAPIRIP